MRGKRRTSSRYETKRCEDTKLPRSPKHDGNYLGLGHSDAIKLVALYDSTDQLVHLKFGKRCGKLTKLIKIISLIAHFHPNLTSLTFLASINEATWLEIQNLIAMTNISVVCFDGCRLEKENYHDVLKGTRITSLSFSRCNIDDDGVKSIMSVLSSNEVVSQTLVILNLSANFIGDQGAKYIGNMLRFNRKLSYLNVAANFISDDGAADILDSFIDFRLTTSELYEVTSRKMTFLKEKENLIQRTLVDLKIQKEQLISNPRQKSLRRQSKIILPQDLKKILRNKAEAIAREIMGEFVDPIVKLENNTDYGFGNDSLVYLNMSYNNLSYLSVKKVLEVLEFQITSITKGLINICIEGNNIPLCAELDRVKRILQIKLDDNKENDSSKNKKGKVVTKAKRA